MTRGEPAERAQGSMRQRYRKRLDKMLALAPDEGFSQLLWAANLLQAGASQRALPYLSQVPREAVTDRINTPLFLYKWELETLANELLSIPKRVTPVRGQYRELDCRRYDALQQITRVLRALENEEAGLWLKRINVLREMPWIAARHFDWQRGWFNVPQFYRSAYVYGQGASAAYFEAQHGLTVNEFSIIGFALHTAFMEDPVIMRGFDMSVIGISKETFERGVKLLSLPIADARKAAAGLRPRYGIVAHQPSILRRYPCLGFGDGHQRLRAPLPQLVLERVTSGIFYDVADAGGEVRSEYGRRFETYCLTYLQAMLDDQEWRPEHAYPTKQGEVRSPDILWMVEGRLRLAIECKATRMSFEARYADDPLAARGYDDIVKAVVQLWRYFSHCRRGLTGVALLPNAAGMMLTLDGWLLMANDLIDDVFTAARKLAGRDPLILPEDQRPIVFCAVTDLENTLATATAATFGAAIDKAIAAGCYRAVMTTCGRPASSAGHTRFATIWRGSYHGGLELRRSVSYALPSSLMNH